jgi:hypothetical protein
LKQQQQQCFQQQQHPTAPCSRLRNQQDSASGYILSAGLDRSMILWGSSGAKVGVFGSSTWDLAAFHTRQHSEEPPAAEVRLHMCSELQTVFVLLCMGL